MTIEPTGSFGSDAEVDLAILERLVKADAGEEIARRVASEYGKDLRTGIRKEPDGKWSVRSTHLAVVSSEDFAAIRASMKRMASALGGTYDGWEAAAKP